MDLSQFCSFTLKQLMLTALTLLLCVNHIHSYNPIEEELICSDICLKQNYIIDLKECLIACGNAIEKLTEDGIIIPETWAGDLTEVGGGGPGNDLTKRQASNFVRIGRQKSGFIRIGRSVEGLTEDQDDKNRLNNEKRMSSFVRIGKADPESMDSEINKRVSSFVRIGKSDPSKYLFKRPSSFVRIGKKSDPEEKRMSSFVRIGKGMPDEADGDNLNENKRLSSFVRIGKKDEIDEQPVLAGDMNPEKRLSSFVRIGRQPELYNDKRTSSFVRIGRGGAKRYSSFVRIGKKDQYDSNNDKRLSSFVRIGKSDPNFSSYGGDSFYPEGTDMMYPENEAAKRASSFVRIGKSYADEQPTSDKRVSSFVRIGKKWDNPEGQKRMSSFVRIGKRSTEESNVEEVDGANSQ